MASTTIFKNFAVAVENKSLIVISNWIASDKYKSEVEEIQSLIAQGKAKEATEKNSSFQLSHLQLHSKKKGCCQIWSNIVALCI